MAKITYRIPTKEAFAFVEIVDEVAFAGGIQNEIRERYDTLTKAFQEVGGDFEEMVRELANTGKLADGADRYAKCSQTQQDALQAVKRLIKRNKDIT